MPARKTQTVLATEKKNSLHFWWKIKPFPVLVYNFLLIQLQRFAPSLALKRWLLRRTGMKVKRNAAIAHNVMFDFFFPEKISLGENCLIGYHCTILAHEFLMNEVRVGSVEIGKNVLLGSHTLVLAGVKIENHARVSALSLVNQNVRKGAFVGGVPVQDLEKGA
jgi:acetyltransferase-like isoleucine patch superfamily enzyme